MEEAEAGIRDPLTGFHIYWKDGLHVDSRHKRIRLRFGGKFLLDGGKIDADSDLHRAFTDLSGYNLHLTRLTVAGWALLWDLLEFKLEIDFANIRQIRDNWFRFIARPETRLTDDRLVDTGKFFNGGFDIINPEFAVVRGPLSFSGPG